MKMKKIVIIGAGDGGRLLLHMLRKFYPDLNVIGFIDDNKKLVGTVIDGLKVIRTSKELGKVKAEYFVNGIGMNIKARKMLFLKAKKAGLKPFNVIHPSAVIDSSAKLGQGVIILAKVVVNPFSRIGDNIFIFSGSIIEHDSSIGNNVYISPGVHIAGHVAVEDNVFFGIGSNVIENVKIGKNSVIGAGALVLKNVPTNVVYAGVPAKKLRNLRKEEIA